LPSRALRNPVYEEANTPSAAETRIQAALKPIEPIEPIEPIRAIPIDFPDTALIGSELGGETSLLEARQVQKPLLILSQELNHLILTLARIRSKQNAF
jgi:hypothetical protein